MKQPQRRQIAAYLLSLAAAVCLTGAARAVYEDGIDRYAYSESTREITYSVSPGGTARFDREDFQDFFSYHDAGDDTLRYVTFRTDSSYRSSAGSIYSDYGGEDQTRFSGTSLENADFYYRSDRYGDYALNTLSFHAPTSADAQTVYLTFTVHGDDHDYSGELSIRVGAGGSTILYSVEPGKTVSFNRSDFRDYFDEASGGDDAFHYVVFHTDDSLKASSGAVYYNFDQSGEQGFTRDTLGDYAFYDSSEAYGDYPLDGLSFAASSRGGGEIVTLDFTAYGRSEHYTGTLEIRIGEVAQTASAGRVRYDLTAGGSVAFTLSDFRTAAGEALTGTLRSVVLTTEDFLSEDTGTLYVNYGKSSQTALNRNSVGNRTFYVESASYGDTALNSLSFAAPKTAAARTVTLTCTYRDSRGLSATGTVEIRLAAAPAEQAPAAVPDTAAVNSAGTPDIVYGAAPGGRVSFSRVDFSAFYQQKSNTADPIRYVTMEVSGSLEGGLLWSNFGQSGAVSFDAARLRNYRFYYSDSTYGNYPLDSLSFAAPEGFSQPVTLRFTAWCSASKRETGLLSIRPDAGAASGTDTAPADSVSTVSAVVNPLVATESVRYIASWQEPVRINADELNRFFQRQHPGIRLESVRLRGLPASGTLFYNYYETSRYGSAVPVMLTEANYAALDFRYDPLSTEQYTLSELTFVPASGVNTCVTIPFTATGSGLGVPGNLLISVTETAVAEVYGVAPKGTTVNFPTQAIDAAITAAAGAAPSGIQLLALPAASVGVVYEGTGTTRATTAQTYSGASGYLSVGALRFVPAADYVGSVEIPYLALDSRGEAMAAGNFCIGVVNTVRRFSDLPASSWCFKYVTELADAGVVGGYPDATYHPDDPVTYGAALKLVLLAAGYPEQPSTAEDPFSAYLSFAAREGLAAENADLSAYITRLEVARLAASAMGLNAGTASGASPFTDTQDPAVLAMNAAGILNGYFEDGVSTFRPGNTLTRGQAAAIVWRMRNYRT